jgi:2-C-methyl-D-erythritol 4-phosphate cytidylyltransferase/2-C-methyl-D-erythritol 2,4-cyclodiphosphate synthase
MNDLAVVLVAAGDGTRLGAGIPKSLVKVGEQSLLEHALEHIVSVPGLSQIVVASHENHVPEFELIVRAKVASLGAGHLGLSFTPGGTSRQGSITNALAKVHADLSVVLVHDAARAFAPAELFDRVANAVRKTGLSIVPVLPIVDSIKKVDVDVLVAAVDRSELRAAQTPQGFVAGELIAAHANAKGDFTDDAALMQSLGKKVQTVEGDAAAFKITTPADLAYAELVQSSGAAWANQIDQRTGIGTDAHRFSQNSAKPLYLGTLVWPGEVGLEGHSDGDAVSHAIVDALLAAAGLGDIGSNFGVDRPEYAGANGTVFIEATLAMLAERGYGVVNVSVQLIGNRPKLSQRRVEVEAALTALVGAPVSVGATTTDGLGFLGSSEGLAAVATALIQKRTDRL